MVIAVVVVVLVVCVGGALLAYSRSDKSRHETRDQFLSRREGETLEERYQEDLRKRDELPPTHDQAENLTTSSADQATGTADVSPPTSDRASTQATLADPPGGATFS